MFVRYDEPEVIADVFRAVGEADLQNLRFYLKDGVDPDLRDPNNNMTLLHRAICDGRTEAARLLLEGGADPNAHGGPSWYTALHYAVYKDSAEMLELLLETEYGTDIEALCQDKQTALHLTAWHARLPLAEILTAHGAQLEPKDARGNTPATVARMRGTDMLGFVEQEYIEVARHIEVLARQRTAEEICAVEQKEKLGQDLDALRRRGPGRFRLQP